jgi:copper chaperone CopZ
MDNLDEIIKNQMIFSYENNLTFRNQLVTIFNNHYLQNIKYHLMWLFFHSFSFAYPDIPSDEYKIETAHFISNVIPKNLGGCGGCQNDYKTYIEKLNVFRIVSSKLELSTFFVNLHNYINNKKFDQQNRIVTNNFNILMNNIPKLESSILFTYEDVKNKYGQTNFITLLESKFNINIFTLIENKSLATFYDTFNKISFDKINTPYNIEIIIK